MQKHLRNKTKQEMLIHAPCEIETSPIVSVLENIQGITLEIHLAIEVLLVESLYGDLALAPVLGTVMLAVKIKVVLHRATGVPGLLVLTGRDPRSHIPEHG